MKKALSICFSICVLFSLCSCGSSSSVSYSSAPTNSMSSSTAEDPDIYPVVAESYYVGQTIVPPPETLYNTYAEENGLDGNIYMVTGTVTDIQNDDSDEYTWIHIDTDSGPVVFANPLNSVLDQLGESGNADKCKSYFTAPEPGDYVRIYGEYIGFSDLFDCASFIYGGSDYMTYAIFDCMADSSSVDSEIDEPNSESSETTDSGTQMTDSQKKSLDSAESYLSFLAFSYSGLIEQLEYEGFSTADATFAADNCGADWNEQALKSGKSYLETMAFSHSGLINQLEYEGFTTDQATYAADNCGADWNEQATKAAANYLEIFSYSRSELISQLEYEGFTSEQAAYGADSNGF